MAKSPIDKLLDQKHAEISVDPSRLKSVTELVDKNREVHERAKNIVDLGNNENVSPPIVLKDSPFEDGQGMAIGFVVLDRFAWNSTTAQTLTIKIYTINSAQLYDIQTGFDDIEKMLVVTDNKTDQALLRLMGREPDGVVHQQGLAISTEKKELDEINATTRVVALKGFYLSRAASLRSNKKRISNKIDEMDTVVEQFEGVINNPGLNPDYAGSMDDDLEKIWDLPEFTG